MKKYFLKTLLLIILLFGIFLTITAFAMESDCDAKSIANIVLEDKTTNHTSFADIEWTYVSTTAELKAAIKAAEDNVTTYIKVTKRIGMTSSTYVTIPEKKDIVIDTNGHSLGFSNKTTSISPITNKGTLTLQDSVGGGNVWGNSSSASCAYPIENYGILTIKDGVAVARYKGTVENTEEDISKIGTLYDATERMMGCIKNKGTIVIEKATLCNDITAEGDVTIEQGNFATNLSAYVKEGFNWRSGSTAFGCKYKSVKETNAEALIGDTEYTTLAEAFAAAENGNTIILNKDVSVANRIELIDITEEAKKVINFDMNGHKVTYTGEANGFILVREYNTVNISGEGIVDIQAGDFFFETNRYAKVNVGDGTFIGATRLAYTSYGSSTMNISGGTWSIDPSNQMSIAETPVAYSGLSKNYIAVAQGTTPETWKIQAELVASVSIDGKITEYTSFDEAIMVAFKSKKAATITVLKDTTSAGNLDTTENESIAGVVLDLNGKTVSVTGTKFMKLYKSTLTITDNTAEGKGKILGTASSIDYYGFIYANSSNAVITVEGGTIEANGESAILYMGGSNTAGIVVNGGSIINKNETDPYSIKCSTNSEYTPSVSINGGYFDGAMEVGSAGSFTILGGTFNFDPEELYDPNEAVIISGDIVENDDATWTVIPAMIVTLFANGEEVGEYATVDQALSEGYQKCGADDIIVMTLLGDTKTDVIICIDDNGLLHGVIPEGITSICSYAFCRCSSLESIVLPSTLERIGCKAFDNCINFKSIIIPEGVTNIGAEAFNGCSSLTEIIIPKNVSVIGANLIANCSALESIVVDKDNIVYDSRNECNAIIETKSNKLIVACKNTIIPEGVRSIGDHAFDGCSSLENITLPSTLETIGSYAFNNCYSIENIIVFGKEIRLDQSSFGGVKAIVYFVEPEFVFSGLNHGGTFTYKPMPIDSLEWVTKPSKVLYKEGASQLDFSGAKILAVYDKGHKKELDITKDMFSGFDSSKIGKQTITVTYEGKTATFEIEIIAKSVSSIQMEELPVTIYLEGKDVLSVSGGKIKVFYDNGTDKIIDLMSVMVSGFNNRIVGPQTLTVTYEGKTTTFDITIIAKSIDYIDITPPTKLEYIESEDELDVTGGKVKIYYNNSTDETIDMTTSMITGFDNTVLGPQLLTVTYGGKTASFMVEIIEQIITGDMDGNGSTDSNDAIYLLMHTLFPDEYPIDNVERYDFDGNGSVNSDDAIYLLMHTLFADDYPLVKKKED